MTLSRVFKSALLASVFTLPWTAVTKAADLILSPVPMADQDVAYTLPAVSGINGKVELSGGWLNLPPGSGIFRGAASLSVPVGHSFGLQGDIAVQHSGSGTLFGGAIHAFTRDPDSYLLGVAAGIVRAPEGTLAVIGPEAELYLDRFTIEAWGGYGNLNYDDLMLADLNGGFLIVDAAYYVTDDWRVSLGGSHLLGYNTLRLGTEYQIRDFVTPLSLTADFRYGGDGAYTIMAGIKGYFGGNDKSLIDRHRQDDPPNRVLSLFSSAGSLLYDEAEEDYDLCPDGEIAVPGEGGYFCLPYYYL
jgi:hypothetical protein